MDTTKNTTELWKPIPGWEELYLVSSVGAVWSCYFRRLLKPDINKKTGYWRVTLSKEGRMRKISVHRAVMLAFVGPCPPGFEVNHKDGIKANNALTNLEYLTPKQNRQHASDLGLFAFGERNGHYTKPERTSRGPKHSEACKRGALRGPARSEFNRRIARRGEHHPYSKLKDSQIEPIRSRWSKIKTHTSQQTFAASLGISQPTLSRIILKQGRYKE